MGNTNFTSGSFDVKEIKGNYLHILEKNANSILLSNK